MYRIKSDLVEINQNQIPTNCSILLKIKYSSSDEVDIGYTSVTLV